jgi:hypothetical protein
MAVDGHGRAMTIARIRSARLLFLSRAPPVRDATSRNYGENEIETALNPPAF